MSGSLVRLSNIFICLRLANPIQRVPLQVLSSARPKTKSLPKMGNFFAATTANRNLGTGTNDVDSCPPSADNEFRRMTEAEWRERLTPDQYRVCRKKGTEPAFTGEYVDNKQDGMYHCVACGAPLFESGTKYNSGSGWPSFYQQYKTKAGGESVSFKADRTLGMARTEVLCAQCDSHLGHVFNDGPAPTGLRYCINSLSLKFQPAKKGQD